MPGVTISPVTNGRWVPAHPSAPCSTFLTCALVGDRLHFPAPRRADGALPKERRSAAPKGMAMGAAFFLPASRRRPARVGRRTDGPLGSRGDERPNPQTFAAHLPSRTVSSEQPAPPCRGLGAKCMLKRTRAGGRLCLVCNHCGRDNRLTAVHCRCCRTRLPMWYAVAAGLCATLAVVLGITVLT